jgi:hypothetical protein
VNGDKPDILRREVLDTGPMSQDLNPCMTPVVLDERSTGETQVKVQLLDYDMKLCLSSDSIHKMKLLHYIRCVSFTNGRAFPLYRDLMERNKTPRHVLGGPRLCGKCETARYTSELLQL